MSAKRDLYVNRPRLAIAISMILVAIVPIVCGWLFYVRANRAIWEEQENTVAQSLSLTCQKLDSDRRDMNIAGLSLCGELRRTPLPRMGGMTVADRHTLYDARTQIRKTLARSSAFVEEIIFFRPGCGYAALGGAVYDIDSFYSKLRREYSVSEEDWKLVEDYTGGDALLEVDGRVFFSMTVAQKEGEAYADRRLVMVLPQRYLEHIAQDYGISGARYTLCARGSGEVLYQTQAAELRDPCASWSAQSEYYGLQVEIPLTSVMGNSLSLRMVYLLLLVCTVVVGAILIGVLSRRTSLPIDEMLAYIRERVQTGGTKDLRGLAVIRESIDRMLQEKERQETQLEQYRLQQQKRELADAMSGNARIEITHPYAVACLIGQPRVVEAQEQMQAPGFLIQTLSPAGCTALLLEKLEGDTDEDEIAAVLERILQALDDAGIPDCCCAMSRVHRESGELEEAWREAFLAADCVQSGSTDVVMRFDAIRFTPEYFLRDRRHLDKMMRFSRQIAAQQYAGALASLPGLFPEEYMSSAYPSMAGLHLSSLKYQLLHDMDTLAEASPDADALRRTLAREIISCRTHGELRELIERELRSLCENVGDESGRLLRIREYICANAADPQLSVTAVAEHFGMPIDKLSKYFAETAGMGVLQYIHKVRLENACELLLSENDLSVAGIGARVGYASMVTFQRAFKARYGMPPGEYRRAHQAQ